ncbi:MAG: alanine--tRNA ligase [Candidatus Gribaldobacteria bacterium]|nr:alanine--tRNA ligase [Candidatus Gribaldobacteria bacterium]
MTAKEIQEKYLKFFEGKGHKVLPSAPLVPENDPTVLFTTAGMQPLVPYLLGEKHPMGNRVCNSQKCIRTGDIDDVGDATHLTFFRMLGNWSLGDYFKKEAIEWSFEFLTKELNIPLEKLAFTVFEGESENNIPKDDEAAQIWQGLGITKERIAYLGRDDNWWGPAGNTGPCGPDTEMFYWTGDGEAPKVFDPSDKKWVEIWNDVFMQYNKTADGQYVPLQQKNVDTGMGLERTTAILQGKNNVYDTELFQPIIKKISEISGKPYQGNEKLFRIMADHLRASSFILAESLTPSNIGRGYILRRLIRRAVRYGRLLGITEEFTGEIAQVVIEMCNDVYSELKENQTFIFSELTREEKRFLECLENGLKFFTKLPAGQISGKAAFDLYQNYGFPIEMVRELAKEQSRIIDEKGFLEEMAKHQELSRTASAGQFKSGLADNSEQTTKYHTATHLMLAALREVLGGEIQQKGSNITAERIRFDFNLDRKMTVEEIKKVEDLVNEKIQANLPVVCEEMATEQAFGKGAVGVFGHKYADRVKVYTVGQPENVCSKEICAGPHVERTGLLGVFKIIKEEASSSGVRRVKAILEKK